MTVSLDWLGCATFRLRIDELTLYLDAYVDRVPGAPPVGITADEIDVADYVLVGHSHFDHIAGAEVIAANTGATLIGSTESARVMRDEGVPERQLWQTQGGEHFRLSDSVTVRTYPSLHSCIWTGGAGAPGEVVTGQYCLTEDERWPSDSAQDFPQRMAAISEAHRAEHGRPAVGSDTHGGAIAYAIETPYGSIFYHDTSGCWTRVVSDLRPDVAIVAMAGRPNVDGEPLQGSLANFVGRMAGLMRPREMFLGHHDNWMPPSTRDMTTNEMMAPVREQLARVEPRITLVEVGYLEGTQLFA